MKYIFLLIIAFLLTLGQSKGQIPFIRHLVNSGFYEEAIFVIGNDKKDYSAQQRDSINYYNGWAHYSLKNLQESSSSFLKVSDTSPFYNKSYFFAGYNQIYLGNYGEARSILDRIDRSDEPILWLYNFELSGIEMLNGKWPEAKQYLELVPEENAVLNNQVLALNEIWKEQEQHREKSPVAAGIMSAILPGSGKIYVGKTGAGIASMIGNIGFGLITWENYRKSGLADVKTILFGSIFAVNYVSNIYGSVVSVKVIENEYENAIHNQILFQLHIPLRNFFD
ncbi:tetratricopeptide repeat protein [uncultured Draconibacterium sp.]|uniref:tetratricopeptide repeat protein n=1 Tax=uncultured Draconibacterium sp. TaxID=1573823 RepID=UPI0029C69D80|nr:tetratricopeptide repeat protein [uncultured Draconibacterium sp.]